MKQIGYSLIGGGFMAKLHTLAINSYPKYFYPPALDVRLECLVDVMPDVAEQAAARYGYKRSDTDWRKLIDDPKTDVISICTPNYLHKEIAMAAIRAGKHVFCEKPLAMNAEDAYEMSIEAEKSGVIAAVGFNNRAIAAVRFLKQILDSNELGEIYSFQFRLIQSWGAPETPMQWRFDSKQSGSGALGDTGSHIIDMILYLLGDISRVCSLSKTMVKKRMINTRGSFVSSAERNEGLTGDMAFVDVDDDTKALIELKNGANGTLWTSRLARAHENTLDVEIYGSKGSARFSLDHPNELEIFSGNDRADKCGFKRIKMGPLHPYGEMWPMADLGVGYVEQKCADFKHFFEAIEKNDQLLVNASFYDGYKACCVIDAIKLSADKNQWIEVEF